MYKQQDYLTLKKKLIGNIFFEDDLFPATSSLLADDSSDQIVLYFRGRKFVSSEVKWLRPKVSVGLAFLGVTSKL